MRSDAVASLSEGPVHTDASASVLNYYGREPDAVGILDRVADAKIKSQAREEGTRKPPLAQISAEPGWRLAIVHKEYGIRVDLFVIALSQNKLCVRDIEFIS